MSFRVETLVKALQATIGINPLKQRHGVHSGSAVAVDRKCLVVKAEPEVTAHRADADGWGLLTPSTITGGRKWSTRPMKIIWNVEWMERGRPG